MTDNRVIFTIGHSNHTLEKFEGLLRQHGIAAVADVRSVPYSRFQPQFDREDLARVLWEQSIAYMFMGKELGARSEDRTCYEDGRVKYRLLANTRTFREGLDRICEGSSTTRIALMCAEREPLECHRTLLISRELESAGVQVVHIHADGHLECHEDAMRRLLQRLRLPEQDMFRSRFQLLDEAYNRQEARIAYVDKHTVREAPQGQT